MHEGDGAPTELEEEGHEAVHVVVLLSHGQVVAADAVRVPARGHAHRGRRHVLDGVPPPWRIEQHVSCYMDGGGGGGGGGGCCTW